MVLIQGIFISIIVVPALVRIVEVYQGIRPGQALKMVYNPVAGCHIGTIPAEITKVLVIRAFRSNKEKDIDP
jgi:hypothetical protein